MKRVSIALVYLLLLSQWACNSSGTGCTDPQANNFNASATENDGSCTYNQVWLNPVNSVVLSQELDEASGLAAWEGDLWTHVDNSDTQLYRINSSTGEIVRKYSLEGVTNTDWEEIAQDPDFIYLGDFGNNGSGNRTDLHILRIDKISLLAGNPSIDTIWFHYSDQTNFEAAEPNQTEFDCEAFLAFSDHIYLFTKQWISGNTTLYSLPKTPGNHTARKISVYNVDGLVSGVAGQESGLVILCGYTALLQPFLVLLYDYKGYDFFSGNKRVLHLNLPFHQVEGITMGNQSSYYIINEAFTVPSQSETLAKLHLLDLSPYL